MIRKQNKKQEKTSKNYALDHFKNCFGDHVALL